MRSHMTTESCLMIIVEDLERFSDLLLIGAATNVEEVRRRAAVELDDVHRCHREASAIYYNADIMIMLKTNQDFRINIIG